MTDCLPVISQTPNISMEIFMFCFSNLRANCILIDYIFNLSTDSVYPVTRHCTINMILKLVTSCCFMKKLVGELGVKII